jgi:hypothetical protein
MEVRAAELKERDAYIAELEREARDLGRLRDAVRAADGRAAQADASERETRRKLAEAEGRLLRLGGPAAGPAVTTPEGLSARVLELEAENRQLKAKEEQARAESWKHLKSRSEAEAAAAEVREDTVRKLKDARKLASVELMRAMEEATKKAVGLREELGRSERERKEALAELTALRAEVAALKAERRGPSIPPPPDPTSLVADAGGEVARAREEVEAVLAVERASATRRLAEESSARAAAEAAGRSALTRAEMLHGQLTALERELSETSRRAEAESERAAQLLELVRAREVQAEDALRRAAEGDVQRESVLFEVQAERERFARLLNEAERESRERAEGVLRTRRALREREREVEALRREVAVRDRKLIELEGHVPANLAAEQAEAELARGRTRVAELEVELARRDAAIERAEATAHHERARAERLFTEERLALVDRNEAHTQLTELEARVALLEGERARLQLRLDAELERARRAETEAHELRRHASGTERLRARAEALEAALKDESKRAGRIEDHLRAVAATLQKENG